MNTSIFLQIHFSYKLTWLSILLFISVPVAYTLIVLLFRRIWVHKKRLVMLQTAHDYEILKARVETQEQTFRNISAEVHDNIGQKLSLAHFLTEGLADRGIDTGDITVLLKKAVSDLRDLSHSLSAETIAQEGLQAVVKRETALLNKGNRIRAEFLQLGQPVQIDIDKATIVYRVFQEAIQNVLKHSNATVVRTLLCMEDGELHMTVADDGIGLTPGAAEGHGFKNMRSRLKLIHGNLSIENAPAGTTLLIKIPLDK